MKIMNGQKIIDQCLIFESQDTRGDLGKAIAEAVSGYSPGDLKKIQWNFSGRIRNINPLYRSKLERTVNGHLSETWEKIRIMNQQGSFSPMKEPLPEDAKQFWNIAAAECSSGEPEKDRIRFLKYLLAGFCIFVMNVPPHPVGMPFPGGDKVQLIDGIYYCPVREKSGDVDSALCPFCPARQTPEIGYLKPPRDGNTRRKQEFIKDTYEHHHFNG
ncbi:Protein of unknown function DUF2115 [Methanolacinia petrolearia DSM 11571]|uniref:UPF0305 protein Mpet_2546 n=2 Tax=Methanolacinia TaxID=230355 RepID=E1RF46_METP4|nr:Protein of unknown function DUF2115 [Methanolacinia petrolearia DSM 11571]